MMTKMMNDDDELAYFTVRWKTRKLVMFTAPKTWNNTDKDSKNYTYQHVKDESSWLICY